MDEQRMDRMLAKAAARAAARGHGSKQERALPQAPRRTPGRGNRRDVDALLERLGGTRKGGRRAAAD